VRRCWYCDEDHLRDLDAFVDAGAKGKATDGNIAVDYLVETGLVNWYFSAFKCFDFNFIIINADDLVANLGQTGPVTNPT
jgi:hypothetical protein